MAGAGIVADRLQFNGGQPVTTREPYILNDNEVPGYDFEKRGRMIKHRPFLFGMTCLDDEEVQRLAGEEFNREEVADIVRFAAKVARTQAEQLETLLNFRDFYQRGRQSGV